MTDESVKPIRVFYSYAQSKQDEILYLQLEKHLKTLERSGLIVGWHRQLVSPGMEQEQEINQRLADTHLVLLLVSPDFIASPYYDTEVYQALERQHHGEARVIPVLLRPGDYEDTPFAHLQTLPSNGKPITTWANRDEALQDVAKRIRKVVEELRNSPAESLLRPSIKRVSANTKIWTIPYRRNPFFTGHQDLLIQLRERLALTGSAALAQPQSISGLGGIGKTQIAIEYAYSHRNKYRYVLWVNAASYDTLMSDYVTIAGLVSLQEKDEQNQQMIVTTIKHWLASHKRWLLILDNADDLEMVRAFLPPVHSGHILLTTREQATADIAQPLLVQPMDLHQGALFLLRRTKLLASGTPLEQASQPERTWAETIAAELDGLPLALDQAGAYIEETGCSLSDYLDLYHSSKSLLLGRRGRLFADHPNNVVTTWSLSFQQIERVNRSAADLLRLCAFLAPDAIPEEIITVGAKELGGTLGMVATDPLKLNEALEIIRRYSLLQRSAQIKMFNMHRLVQVVLVNAMDRATQQYWAKQAISAVSAAFPSVGEGDLTSGDHYLPHVQACVALISAYQLALPEAASLLHQAGAYLYYRARYSEAEALYQHALRIGERVLGSEHPKTAATLHELALLYHTQGEYTEAEALYLRVLHISEQTLGAKHPETAATMHQMAVFYHIQGKYEQAEIFYEQARKTYEQILGFEHPTTQTTKSQLSRLSHSLRSYPVFRRSRSGLTFTDIIPMHLSKAKTLFELAQLYHNQGKYQQAELFYQQALDFYKQEKDMPQDAAVELHEVEPSLYGPDEDFQILSRIYEQEKDAPQGEDLHKQPNPFHSRALPTRFFLHRTGSSLYKRGDWEKFKLQGIAATLHELARLYHNQGKDVQAEIFYQKALNMEKKGWGSEHPNLAKTLSEIAQFYCNQGKYAQAEIFYQKTLSMWEKMWNPEHPDPDRARTLSEVAQFYYDQGKYAQAEPLYQQALRIYEDTLKMKHPETVELLHLLAVLYQDLGKYAEAENLYQRALAVYNTTVGPQHPSIGRVQHHLAALYQIQGKYAEAEPIYQQSLAICERILGSQHPDSIIVRENYAALLRIMRRKENS